MHNRILLFVCILLLNVSSVIAQNPGDKVLSIFVDEFDHQWFGTDKGLLRKCGDLWKAYNMQPGSPGIVNDIKHKNNNISELWIGTKTGIVKIHYSSLNIDSSTFFNSSVTSFRSDIVNSVTFDEKDIGYFTTPLGIGIFARVWRFYTRLVDVVRNEFTSAAAKGDTIYFGTRGEGVTRVVKSADVFTGASAYLPPWSSLTGDTITDIFIDSKGYQWFGTTKGISRHTSLEAKEGWDFFLTDELPNKHVTSITGDLNGNIWAGTKGGLVMISSDLHKIKTWTVNDGMSSDVINDVFIGKDQSVWIGTNKGASIFDGSGFLNIKISDYEKDYIDLQ